MVDKEFEIESIWVVIPAFNETGESTIVNTIKSVKNIFRNIVVVDDCSSDDTGQLALSAGAHVCRHPINLGQGAALATGIQYALSKGANAIITFDADGQHSEEDALEMYKLLLSSKKDVVLGSRFKGGKSNIPTLKRYFLLLATLFTRITTGVNVTDTHNGLRVLSKKAAREISIKQNRMAHASEILSEIRIHSLSFVEYPTTITYTDYSIKKGQKISGSLNILADLMIGRIGR